MGNVLRLYSPIPPSVNHYLAHRVIMTKGKPMAMVYETKEAKDYKESFKKYVIEQVREQGWEMPEDKYQHIYVDEVFYFGRTDLDAQNYSKLLHDQMTETGVVWIDDNIVCERVQRIYYDKENPRIELTIYPVEYIGIFDNREQLDAFEGGCKECKRYGRNCSLLKNAKIGRIQEEIVKESTDITDVKIVCRKRN